MKSVLGRGLAATVGPSKLFLRRLEGEATMIIRKRLGIIFFILLMIILPTCGQKPLQAGELPKISAQTNAQILENKPIVDSKTSTATRQPPTITRKPSTFTPTITMTMTLDKTSYFTFPDISKLLFTNTDDPNNNKYSSWIFQNIDLASQIITKPNASKLCEVDCASVSWSEHVIITLYLIRDETKSSSSISWLKNELINQYPNTRIEGQDKLSPIINNIMPGHIGWASKSVLANYHFAEYYATNCGPIIIYIVQKYTCADGCDTGYPEQMVYLAKYQCDKIGSLLRD